MGMTGSEYSRKLAVAIISLSDVCRTLGFAIAVMYIFNTQLLKELMNRITG
jgi:hypothetical protein